MSTNTGYKLTVDELVVLKSFTNNGTEASTGNQTIGDSAADTLTVNATSQFNAPITVGVDDTGYDVKFFGATSGKYMLWDESADQLNVYGTMYVDGKLNLGLNNGDASASGILMGVGTTNVPALSSSAGAMFAEFRTKNTAGSGDSRGLYWRHEIGGVGAGGESIRNFTKVNIAASTARGSHTSLDLGTTGSVSGLGAGVDAQISVADAALTGGTYAVVNVEAYSAGTSTDVSGVTAFDIFRVVLGGDSTGAATVDAKANLFNFEGVTAGAGNLIDTGITTHTAYGGIPVNIGGTVKYLALVSD